MFESIKYDQTVKLAGINTSKFYPDKIRKIKFYDKERKKNFYILNK